MADSPRTYQPSTPIRSPGEVETTVAGTRLGAKALFVRSEQVLLIEEGRDDGSAFWTLPGGGVAPGESLTASLRRELDEELRCSATCGRPVGTCRYEHTSFGDVTTVYTVFDCTLASEPEPNGEEDILAYDWVAPADPPEGMLDPFAELLQDLVAAGYFDHL